MTEWISGVNIPACQLLIGMGVPLHQIPDIRRLFGRDPGGSDPIDFEADPRQAPLGHVVAVRVTAGGWVEGGREEGGREGWREGGRREGREGGWREGGRDGGQGGLACRG